mmetsp:Transcript_18655/g.51365  ORF Transcript_18655/g.51365 Transcript_18655/m.51365 type:complete len:80 (-) Transcript_18655:728-967(-)
MEASAQPGQELWHSWVAAGIWEGAATADLRSCQARLAVPTCLSPLRLSALVAVKLALQALPCRQMAEVVKEEELAPIAT